MQGDKVLRSPSSQGKMQESYQDFCSSDRPSPQLTNRLNRQWNHIMELRIPPYQNRWSTLVRLKGEVLGVIHDPVQRQVTGTIIGSMEGHLKRQVGELIHEKIKANVHLLLSMQVEGQEFDQIIQGKVVEGILQGKNDERGFTGSFKGNMEVLLNRKFEGRLGVWMNCQAQGVIKPLKAAQIE